MLSEVLEQCLQKVKAEQRALETPKPSVVVAPVVAPVKSFAPTDKQINFFHALVDGKQLTDDQRTKLRASLPALDKRSITSTIEWLVQLPWMQRKWVPRATTIVGQNGVTGSGGSGAYVAPYVHRPSLAPSAGKKLDQGYYAIVDPQDKAIKFFQVRTPNRGKWAGYVFLSVVSGDNKFGVRDRNERERIFIEIAKNPLEALKLFGKEIGQCGHCRKQLTDEESRTFGIGPVCRKKLGV
jgi:hypothetical protein